VPYYSLSNGVAYQQSALHGLLAAPLLAMGIEPIVANLLLILELTVSGMLTYLLVYAVTGQVIPSLVAGSLFAFHPNRMDHLGQFTYQQAVLFPLIVWAVYRFVVDGTRRHLWLAVVALWAQVLSSLYNGYALGILVAALTVGLLVLRPDRLTGALALRVGAAALVLGWPWLRSCGPTSGAPELGFQRTLAEGTCSGWTSVDPDPAEFSRSTGPPDGAGTTGGRIVPGLRGARAGRRGDRAVRRRDGDQPCCRLGPATRWRPRARGGGSRLDRTRPHRRSQSHVDRDCPRATGP
jgi:hypothetical protein